jgi:acetyl esterase/lipase
VRKRGPEVVEVVEAYGQHPLQIGEWYAPAGDDLAPTVVLIHGGFWGERYERHLEHHVAMDLARRGYLCWNIDYRSGAEPWPATLSDVAAAYDHISVGSFASRVDTQRVAVVGHSAGGHLAAWLASRHRLPAGAPGHNPDVLRPTLAVPQAGVVALTIAAENKVGRGAPQAFVGGQPETYPERYAIADPIGLLPTGVRSVLIHGPRDKLVPLSQSRHYVEAATAAGDDSRLEISRGDHFTHLDPKSAACQQLRDALATMSA